MRNKEVYINNEYQKVGQARRLSELESEIYISPFCKGINPPVPPFTKGGLRRIMTYTSPFTEEGLRGIFHKESNRNIQNSHGFTLIEVLVAMAIMAMTLIALYSTFTLANRALFNVDQSLVKLQEARAFVDTLKREIESAFYSKDISYCVFKMDDRDFYGRQTSSLTVTSSSLLIKGLANINYAVEERNGILVITKSMVSALSQSAENNMMDLLEDIESFTLQAKYQNAWVKTWDSSLTKITPDEVKIILTIRMKNRDGKDNNALPFSIFETARVRIGTAI
jgi:prepilin-type N-terminal cleavage/methylation domain-containing protein